MNNLLLVILSVLLSVPHCYAQELAFAAVPTAQVEQVDLSKFPMNFVKPEGNRKKGVACMITGGVFIVAGIPMIAAADHGDPKAFSSFLWGVGGWHASGPKLLPSLLAELYT